MLDRKRFTTIAHRDHVYCNPIGAEKMDRVIALLELSPDATVLDVGCGKGELLIRIIERYGVKGVGVDNNGSFLADARARAAARVPAARLELHEMEFERFPLAAESFDMASCVGSTHASGGLNGTLQALQRAVKPGGYVLIGEGYWKREPAAEYLAALEATRGEFSDHAGNVVDGIESGLTPLYATASSHDEWDHYEGLYARAIERHLIEHPDDPEHQAMAERIRSWQRDYLKWGRDTLGFGLYLFVKSRT